MQDDICFYLNVVCINFLETIIRDGNILMLSTPCLSRRSKQFICIYLFVFICNNIV